MAQNNDEKKHARVIKLLKSLPEVKAPSNFETELVRRINSDEPLRIKESWLDKIFSPKLIPSAALAVTAVIILFLLKGTFNDVEDPFQFIPKLREDSLSENRVSDFTQPENSKELANNRTERSKTGDSNVTHVFSNEAPSLEKISVVTTNYTPDESMVTKGGLNFKILRDSEKDREEIEMLREKMNRLNSAH